jgi:endoglucanase
MWSAFRGPRIGAAVVGSALCAQGGTATAAPLAAPKVNQVGYLPSASKTLHVTESDAAAPGAPVTVVDSTTGQTVWSGALSSSAIDDTASTGESVLSADLSSLSTPGTYVAVVGGMKSPSFSVAPSAYNALYRDALRTFYLIRCGVAIDDAETGIQHPACHTHDAILRDAGTTLDLTGGWHNAGDFGKWTHEAAISTSLLLWLAELNPGDVLQISVATPESGDGVPDLLNEARWGLTWLLKMQQTDGSVLHKVDTQPNFAWGVPPQSDPYTRMAGFASTVDAADFTAVMLQAARVFQKVDSAFAGQCAKAANASWAWVQANESVPETDPYYPDADPSQEILWATGEMLRATHDPKVAATWTTASQNLPPGGISWLTPQPLGYVAVALDPAGDPGVANAATQELKAYASSLASLAAATGYGVITQPSGYYWESNEALLGETAVLLFEAAIVSDDPSRQLALAQLGWLLGDNALNKSFVTGYGASSVLHPYHWTYHALNRLMPGWASGGPNEYDAGVDTPLLEVIDQGTPPAECYVDEGDGVGSWASNEGEILLSAELVFATGSFASAAGLRDADAGVNGEVSDGAVDAGTGTAQGGGGGCGCSAAGSRGSNWMVGVCFVAVVALRRRGRSIFKQ